MYILIPILLIVLSIVGITYIVWRKFGFLKKLTPDDDHRDAQLVDLYFPEIKSKYNNLDASEYKKLWLSETEKGLRRLRMVSLKIDRFSDSLIKKVRHAHSKEQAKSVEVQEKTVNEAPAKIEELFDPVEMLKKEEQRLIIEIAKNPKDVDLYLALGEVYIKLESLGDALNSYETCLRLDPQNEMYLKKVEDIKHRMVNESH